MPHVQSEHFVTFVVFMLAFLAFRWFFKRQPHPRKLLLNAIGFCVLLLLACYLNGAISSPDKPVEILLAECRVKGWQEKDLALKSSQVSNFGVLSKATVTLTSNVPNRPKTIRAVLRNWFNLLGWEFVDYREE